MTDTDTTTIAVRRDTKRRLDRNFDGTYDEKIRTLLDEYDRRRVVIEADDDGELADVIEEHTEES